MIPRRKQNEATSPSTISPNFARSKPERGTKICQFEAVRK